MHLHRALLFTAALAAPIANPLTAQTPPLGFTYETLVDGPLDSATAMAFLPDGRLFLTERATGHIRQFRDGALDATPWATVPVNSGGSFAEQGLLGIAIDPDFLNNGYVYVFYTALSGLESVIARLQEANGVGTNLTVLSPVDAIPSQFYHNGGVMIFGVDGSLFVGTGDGQADINAQDPASWLGKILRFAVPNLTIPADNPTPGSAVYTMGHRNQFGLAIHPVTGGLYQTENGDAIMDEVNLIVAGGNYGWPVVEGQTLPVNPLFNEPLASYQPTIAPTGCCFYAGAHYPSAYENAWFVADYNMNRLRMLTLDALGQTVSSQAIFDTLPGAGYSVLSGPDGNLWFLTNDTGGYGADEIGRYVHANEANPSAQISSVSNKTLGGSVTVCVHADNNSWTVPWLSLTSFSTPLPTPFGDLWVNTEALLPLLAITADARVYLGTSMPNSPSFIGSSIHLQAAVLSPMGSIALTNPSEIVIRG